MTPASPPVDYDRISLADLVAEAHYYTTHGDALWFSRSFLIFLCAPVGESRLIDCKALNDRIASSEQMPRGSDFCQSAMERDGEQCLHRV